MYLELGQILPHCSLLELCQYTLPLAKSEFVCFPHNSAEFSKLIAEKWHLSFKLHFY